MKHEHQVITPQMEAQCWAWVLSNHPAIHDKHAFEDAQIMARAAIEMTERWWKEAYWYGAMQALKAAYKGRP